MQDLTVVFVSLRKNCREIVPTTRLCFLALLCPLIGLLALLGSYMIPESCITPNAALSAKQIKEADIACCKGNREGFLRRRWHKMTQPDYFTDAVMIDVAVSCAARNPLERTLDTHMYAESQGICILNPVGNLEHLLWVGSDGLPLYDYSRYWHGYLLLVRPLLLFFHYDQIRTLNFFVLNGLLLLLLYLIYKRLGVGTASCFLLSMLSVAAPMAPMNWQFMDCFFIAYVASLCVLCSRKRLSSSPQTAILFFTSIGVATSYFDFLTTPILTLCLPLAFLTLLQVRQNNARPSHVLLCAVFWFAGYSYMWASKWVLTSLLTSNNILHAVFQQIMLRSYGAQASESLSILSRLQGGDVIGAVALLILFFLYVVLARKKTCKKTEMFAVILVGVLPLVWFMLAMEHSLSHMRFTWRALVGSIFPFLWAIFFCTSPKALLSRIFRRERDACP